MANKAAKAAAAPKKTINKKPAAAAAAAPNKGSSRSSQECGISTQSQHAEQQQQQLQESAAVKTETEATVPEIPPIFVNLRSNNTSRALGEALVGGAVLRIRLNVDTVDAQVTPRIPADL